MHPLELKRRLTWMWRLALSDLRHECNGEIPALWVFDTIHQPDGAVLGSHVRKIAFQSKLHLHSFGPQPLAFARIPRILRMLVASLRWLGHADFDAQLYQALRSAIFIDASIPQPEVVLVGASKGTFARAVLSGHNGVRVWEVQHGLLDRSYFPMQAERFFVRSNRSAELIRRLEPQVVLEQISGCLAPPSGSVQQFGGMTVGELACFSKNPGGGCTALELMEFERSCRSVARRLGIAFTLHLHPRDNLLKLMLRHRSVRPLRWVLRRQRSSASSARLIVSAYSSALVSNSMSGDRLLNVRIGVPDEIVRHEYGWLPTIEMSALASLSENTDVFLRSA